MPIVGRLVKLVGSGIGLAAEAVEARKTRSRSQSPSRSQGESSSSSAAPPPAYSEQDRIVEVPDDRAAELIAAGKAVPYEPSDEKKSSSKKQDYGDEDDDEDSDVEHDEDEWELDDAAAEVDPPSYEESEQTQTVDELVRSVMNDAAPTTASTPQSNLPCPVLIPQRRPKDKSRGFVRAYAPALDDCGIDQATFLRFLKNFHQASKASPYLDVIFIGAGIVGFVPDVAAMVVSTVVQIAAGTAKELQSRKRSNDFLSQMNAELFAPRGLYAFVMTYKPDSTRSVGSEQVDISKNYIRYMETSESKVRETLKGIRISDGKAYGELELPECAPLVYPSLEEAAKTPEGMGKLKASQKFLAGYMDRRAQASYAHQHPDSSLAAPQATTQFASRYSDPNHAANSGSLISLLTGGAINPAARRQRRREAKRERINARRHARGLPPRRQRRNKEKGGLVKRIMQQDVLYLMIVNMPTDQELEAAKQALGKLTAGAAQQQKA